MVNVKGFYYIRNYTGSSTSWGSCMVNRSNHLYMDTCRNSLSNDHVIMLWNVEGNYYNLVSATDVITEHSESGALDYVTTKKFIDIFQNLDSEEVNVLGDGGSSFHISYVDEGLMVSGVSYLMTKTGTTTVNGESLDVVTFKSYSTGEFLDWQKAVSGGRVTTKAEDTTTNYQKFTLQSMTPYTPSTSSPQNLCLCWRQKEWNSYYNSVDWNPETGLVYPAWSTDYYALNNEASYRLKTQTKDNSNKWSSATYTDWVKGVPPVTRDTTCWGDSVALPKTSASIKAVKATLEVNTTQTVAGVEFVTPTSTKEFTFARKPVVKLDSVSWSPEGLSLDFASNYFNQGSCAFVFKSVKMGGKNLLKSSEYWMKSILKDETKTIPTENFTRSFTEGDEVNLEFYIQTDIYAPSNYVVNLTGSVTYEAGSVDVTPTITELDGFKIKAEVAYANTVRMWLSCDGQLEELTGSVSNGKTSFEFLPPFQKEYGLFVSYKGSNGDWGTTYKEMPVIKVRAHGFWWDGGSVILWLNKDDPLNEKFSFKAQSETHTLAGRNHDYVSYLTNGNKNYVSVTGDITGYILPTLKTYGTTKESIEKMLEVGHVHYRSPYGRICNVAVTDASVTTERGISEVTLSIVQEDV